MQVLVSDTTLDHQRALAQVRDLYSASADRMNGRHLRKVLMAYLEARGMADLPIRVRRRTEHGHGLQSHYLCIEYPDPGETYSHERNDIEIPDGFDSDLFALLHEWYDRNYHRLVVLEQSSYLRTSHEVRYNGCRVTPDPWFHERA